MSDNPRVPGHPSDVPSSRATGRNTDSPASPLNSGSANPIPSPSSSSTNKLLPRNIIIGALVTVITSTTVFYLTQYVTKKPEGNDFLITKEATTTAWKSYVGYENIYTENFFSLIKTSGDMGLDSQFKSIKKESEKFQKDVADLSSGKKIDKDLIKVLNRRLDNETRSMPVVEQYYKKIDSIFKSKGSPGEKKDALVNEMSRYSEFTKGFYERAINEIRIIAEILSKRYGEPFSMNDFAIVRMKPQITMTTDSVINMLRNVVIDSSGKIIRINNYTSLIKPDNVTGKWSSEGATITLSKNGKMNRLASDGSNVEGTWKIEKDKLIVLSTAHPDNRKIKTSFNIAELTANSFKIMLDEPPYNIYLMTRIIEK
jgi:hypothetical protein